MTFRVSEGSLGIVSMEWLTSLIAGRDRLGGRLHMGTWKPTVFRHLIVGHWSILEIDVGK